MKRVGKILAVTLVVLQLCSDNLWARPTTQNEAEKVVKAWLKANPQPLGAALGRQVTKIETYTGYDGNPLYYIVYLQPNGFVIVSADDLIEPIIGFVEEGFYDPSPTNPLGALVTGDLNGRVRSVRTTGRSVRTKTITGASVEPQSKWDKFIVLADVSENDIGALGISTIDDVRVSPFVQSRWYQTTICTPSALACYNYYTPGDSNNGQGTPGNTSNYPSGCVATALAQIMRYYQWPNTGIGTGSFSVKIRGAIYSRNTRGGDGAGGAYNWAQMPYDPASICGTITDAQRQAIGALCYDAGVGISNLVSGEYTRYYDNYPYTPPETDAYTQSAKAGLISTFKYGNAVYGYNSGNNIGNGLIGMVNPNLDANLPVCFGIHGSGSTGHEVVCDGYGYNSGTMYHHINMGWGGSQDAWYDLPDITTDYNSVYETIYNIYKLGTGEIFSGRVTDPCGNPISDVNVYQQVYPGFNPMYSCLTNAKGIYHFYGVLSDTNFAVWAAKTGYVFPSYPGQVIRTGRSTDSNSTSGNIWGVNIVCIGPDINTISPTSGPGGTYMKIQGTHFGSSPGQVVFPGVGYYGDILQWSDTVILCQVPFGVPSSGSVKVHTSLGVEGAGAYFEVTDPTTIYVDANHTPDVENGTTDYPFSTIQRGIDAATNEDTVIVNPGTYYENISLDETNITLTSTDPNDPCVVASTIIDGNENGTVVTFTNNCSALSGFTITDGYTEAGFGGGIFCNGQCEEGGPTISHCVITHNMAEVAGGGIYCSDSSPTIYKCIITGNWASSSGGGICCQNDNIWYYPTINHCLIVGNSSNMGGGILLGSSTATIGHCDITSNYADDGGGIFCNDDVNLMISNSILWADMAIDYGSEIFVIISNNPAVVNIEYSDVQGGLAGMSYPPGHQPYWDANDINANPMFVRDPNPGPDGYWDDVNDDFGDLHLRSVSPCIDAGDKNYVPDSNETDIDGQPRIVGCRVDIGADEFVYLGDIDLDGDVDFADFAVFADYWHDTNCGKCGGADLTGDGIVDIEDLAQLAENWPKSLCKD